MFRTREFWFDLGERVIWTAIQAGLGVLYVEVTGWGVEWAVPVAAGLAYVKALVAKQIGNHDTASTLPASVDPAS